MSETNSTLHGFGIARELYSLGMDLVGAGMVREAAFQFTKALALNPDFSDASLALGHCLHATGQFEAALEQYQRLLSANPRHMAAWNNRGITLLEMGHHDEAAGSFRRALEISPGFHDARVALATCYQALGRMEEALAACDGVLAVAPDHAEAHWNRSLLLLLKGDYPEGWREYEWRWKKRNFTSPRRDFQQPCWHGEPGAGKTILIHAEQGFGDTLQFCRYVPLVKALGARVVYECHPPLAALMKGLGPGVEVIAMGQPLPTFDLHVPLMSLPLVFGTTLDTVPATIPYLTPPEDRLPFWSSRIKDGSRMKAGLCWAGKSYPDPRRSCPVKLLAGLARLEGVSWYSLQAGWKAPLPLPMTDLTGLIRDFADTAALISQLDFVITIDTSVAHLSGALGKPTWVMLPHAPDWRWMLEREDSPWYPSMRLLRLKQPGAWHEVIQRVSAICTSERHLSSRT
jgi:hypothetical protein